MSSVSRISIEDVETYGSMRVFSNRKQIIGAHTVDAINKTIKVIRLDEYLSSLNIYITSEYDNCKVIDANNDTILEWDDRDHGDLKP